MAFLELKGLVKRYDQQAAVDNLSLSVERGEFIALLGPSGCGKTTTLQMIAGFVDPTAGAILLEGRDLVSVKPAQRGLGVVFQSYALFPHMTVAENVAFGLEMRGVSSAERQQRVGDALELVGLSGLADRYPRRMSGGQQQRVALARALVIQPQILLLDEPLSNLDAKLREEMRLELRQIQRTLGTTTLLVTHDQGEAMALADRIVVMHAGKIEQIGRPDEVYEWPATPFVANFLGKTNLLAGELDQHGTLKIAGGHWPIGMFATKSNTEVGTHADLRRPGPVTLAIRPEKIRLRPEHASHQPAFSAEPGYGELSGTVATRVFQGDHWLYQIRISGHMLTVICPNDGGTAMGEGEAVRAGWLARDARLRAPNSPTSE